MDPRIKKLAEILTNYSIKIKKGDTIIVNGGTEAKDLVLEVCRLILEKGAFPRLNMDLPGFAYIYYKTASDEQLRAFPKITEFEVKNSDGVISIGSDYNTKELTNVNPKKISMRMKVVRPIQDFRINQNNWVIVDFPTHALAQDAEMSLHEFEDFVFNATNIEWENESKKQDKLKKLLDNASTVRIVGEDTDISFSIKGRKAIKCDGHRNMPDGEVFIAPVDNSVNGHIAYSFPASYAGKEVTEIKLWFKEGRVVKFSADKNEDMLKEAINTDDGAKKIGEFGIGLNYTIKNHVKNTLFDEKIGGTIHLALGMAYPEGGGKNKSAIHWDMIKDLRKKGQIIIDGKCIQKNGKWMI